MIALRQTEIFSIQYLIWLIREDSHKEGLVKEELHKEEAGPASQKLYKDKCSPCHVLPDIDAYGYTPEQWVKIIDGMHNPGEYSAFITSEEDEKIKDYLKDMSQKNNRINLLFRYQIPCLSAVKYLLYCKTTPLFYNNHQYAAWLAKEEVIQG